jgi:hypothetical protein
MRTYVKANCLIKKTSRNGIAFLVTFLRLFFLALGSKREVLSRNALLKKENEILVLRFGKRRVQFDVYDKRVVPSESAQF